MILKKVEISIMVLLGGVLFLFGVMFFILVMLLLEFE